MEGWLDCRVTGINSINIMVLCHGEITEETLASYTFLFSKLLEKLHKL